MGPAMIAGVFGLVVAAAGGFYGGQRLKQAEWDAAELDRTRELALLERRRQVNAQAQSAGQEAVRAAIAAELRRSQDALSIALRTPVSCPPAGESPLELGDVLLPAGVLDGVRDAAGVVDRLERAAAEPGVALQRGAADPGR